MPGYIGIHNLTDEQYFDAGGLNNSYLWQLINRTPAHAQIKTAPTDAMDLGSATHLAVLQPELASEMIIQGPADRRGKKWKEAQTESEGKILLVEKDYNTCMSMRDKVWQSPAISSIISGDGAVYEQSAFWDINGWGCKCKVDCAKPNVIIDLKTSADASPRGFSQSVAKYGYHQQAASYKYGWSTASGQPVNHFIFLVIEKSPPFAVAIYELDTAAEAEGWASYLAAIGLHNNCVEREYFPAYPAEKVLLGLPPYAFVHTDPREINLGESK